MKATKPVGFLLILYAGICFLTNFGIFAIPLLGNVHLLWNPLDALLTGRIVGNIPILSGSLGWLLNYIFALIYSGILGIVGLILLLH